MNKSLMAVGFALASMVSMSANAYTDMWTGSDTNTYVHTSSGLNDDGYTNMAVVNLKISNEVFIGATCKKPTNNTFTESVSVVNGQQIQTLVVCKTNGTHAIGRQWTNAKTAEGRLFIIKEFLNNTSVTIDGDVYTTTGFIDEYKRVNGWITTNTPI